MTKKWIKVNDLSSGQCSVSKNIRFKTSMLRSNSCGYSDAYNVVKGTTDFLADAANKNNKAEKNVAFENNSLFRSCISKINSTLIENAEDLDIVMPMYNLLEYSENYLMTSGSLWNYYREEIDDVDDNASDGKSFKYKTKIVGKSPERPPQPGNPGDVNRPAQPAVPTLNVEVTIPLKYLSNFWKFLDLPLINCEIELDLSRKKDCVLIERHNITGVNFMITSTKLYVPVVTLSVNDNINFLEN